MDEEAWLFHTMLETVVCTKCGMRFRRCKGCRELVSLSASEPCRHICIQVDWE